MNRYLNDTIRYLMKQFYLIGTFLCLSNMIGYLNGTICYLLLNNFTSLGRFSTLLELSEAKLIYVCPKCVRNEGSMANLSEMMKICPKFNVRNFNVRNLNVWNFW